jgi:hypothetical protein
MKYYKKNNQVFAFEADGSQDHLITNDMVQMSSEEIAAHRQPTAEQIAQARIFELRQLLRDTDYVALPDYDKDKPEILTQRQAWRVELRGLLDEGE